MQIGTGDSGLGALHTVCCIECASPLAGQHLHSILEEVLGHVKSHTIDGDEGVACPLDYLSECSEVVQWSNMCLVHYGYTKEKPQWVIDISKGHLIPMDIERESELYHACFFVRRLTSFFVFY